MSQARHHELTIIDFEKTGQQTIFVKLAGFDANLEKNFAGEVKFVGAMPYGDLIHAKRSFLSAECREYIQSLLVDKYSSGAFN
ncbi:MULTISPECIES: hypothetical protein [Bacillaceae]|uniref:hypothetical protein n=1 Tax=Bacillaceae TaxID=186817 RepID=UPI001E4CFAD6|nr:MULTISPECIES: hypothetical protein [Bacillaceae]MCE4049386.1 hypothetical protein [Bacillus sp. Au-Bac7]MCM3032406.1 hypothetical protein [Niallia sp. MER 6]UPO90198.1 hypothetical protein L8T27_025935 [Niallia sp. Man26]